LQAQFVQLTMPKSGRLGKLTVAEHCHFRRRGLPDFISTDSLVISTPPSVIAHPNLQGKNAAHAAAWAASFAASKPT
jgi:hypothetical protein